MTYGQASAMEEALKKLLENENIRGTVYIRIHNGEIQVYNDIEELPEIEEMKDRGLYL